LRSNAVMHPPKVDAQRPGDRYQIMAGPLALPAFECLVQFRVQRSDIALVGAHLRVRPENGQTHRSAPTEVSILCRLESKFVSGI
jgi:hypothetical protein